MNPKVKIIPCNKTLQGILLCMSVVCALLASLADAAPAGFYKTGVMVAAIAPRSGQPEEMVYQLMVKPRQKGGEKLRRALQGFDASVLSERAAVRMHVLRAMSNGAHVMKLHRPVSLSEARIIAARLMRDSSVEIAEPDRILRALTTTPTDPSYAGWQWHYFAPAGANKGGADLPDAWDISKGSAAVNVAVLDTGYRQHADLGTVLPGYDFISNASMANDGDGRDGDAQDPGNWVVANECGNGNAAANSSWHGTHVAGTIAALMNNAAGGTGVAPNVKILPVRVLGKCGGLMSDVIDGMRWAAGLSVPGVPANPHPALVLNMSLGDTGTCAVSMQSAVTEILNAGKIIVAASGNNASTSIGMPANCSGVIAVTAHAIDGDNAYYADIGPEVTISAPGGGCGTISHGNATCTTLLSADGPGVYSTLNAGMTVPGVDAYALYQGTSMAVPHVAGVVALMLSVNATLTPAQVKSYLQSSVRAHPAGSTCVIAYPGKCGAGMLDALAALNTVLVAPPVVTLTTSASRVVAPGVSVSLSGVATPAAGRTIASYAWTQASGAAVGAITNTNTANASFTAPATGTYSFTLTATDNTAQTGAATAIVRVNSAPLLTAVATQSGTAGGAINFNVGATDADGDTPIFHALSLPPGASLSAGGAFSWPSATAGSHTLVYYASDNDANSGNGSVTINVVAPAGSGGGGGSFDAAALLGLALLALGWRVRRTANAVCRFVYRSGK